MSDLTPALSKKINDWIKLKNTAKTAVEAERDARQELAGLLFPNPAKGTQRFDLGGGYAIKLVHGTTYTLFEPVKAAERNGPALTLYNKICALGNEGPALAARIVKFKPELSSSEYEKLDTNFEVQAKIKALIDEALTTKPSSPQMDFEEPKVSGK